MVENDINSRLAANGISNYRFFDTIGSTNDEAIKWMGNDAPEYAIVIASSQTAGRGRQNRKWVTTPGSSIAMSVILTPNEKEIAALSLFSLLGGLAVRKAINVLYAIQAKVKWPNDVLIDGKKCAGVLTEAIWEKSLLKGLVIGIGINVYKESIPSATDLIFPATCIQDHTTSSVNPTDVISQTFQAIKTIRESIGNEDFLREYEKHLAFKGEKIILKGAEEKKESGILTGIDPTGNVLLKTDSGKIKAYTIGDISLRKL